MTREEQLIKQTELGDPEAAEALMELLYPEILRYCLWHAPSRSLAEDAAQETFLKAIRYWDRYVPSGRFKAFLYRIAANTCIDMRRKYGSAELSLEELPDTLPSLEDGYERVQSDLALRQSIRSLSPEQQEIILLRFGQELTLRQIGQITGLPLRTVQSKLRSALKKLKQELEEEHCDKQKT